MEDHPLYRKRALEKLQAPEQLDQLLTVTSPRSWLALFAIGGLLIAALLWGFLATVEVSLTGDGVLVASEETAVASESAEPFEAIIFVSIEDSRRIHPGMTARIAPATVRKEEYGLLRGRVTAVNPHPSTQGDMVTLLGNDAFVQFLAAEGKLVAVHVALFRNETTPSGYSWTSADGPPQQLSSGIISSGAFVISQQKPIDLILPSSLQGLGRS